MKKINYGFDGPDFKKQAGIFGTIAMTASYFLPIFFGNIFVKIIGISLFVVGIIPLILVAAMIVYGIIGKYCFRDLMLSKIN